MTTSSRQVSEEHTHSSLVQVTTDARAEIDPHEMDNSIKLMDIVGPAPTEISPVEKVPPHSTEEHPQHSNQFHFAEESNSQGVPEDTVDHPPHTEQVAQSTHSLDADNVPPHTANTDDVDVHNPNAISTDSISPDPISTHQVNADPHNDAAVNEIDARTANTEHVDVQATSAPNTDADDMSDENANDQAADAANAALHEAAEQVAPQHTASGIDSDADSTGSEKELEVAKTEAELNTDAEHATAAAAAAAAAIAAAAVSSGVASSTVPTMTVPMSSIMTASTAYQPFAQMATNGTPLMPHSLVSVPMPVGRRAVRIAPMGVLPLPPQGGVSTALAPDLQTQNATVIMAPPSAAQVDGNAVEPTLHSPVTGAVPQPVPELTKGKRRGVSGSPVQTIEGLTTEERTKQKRMLRNRESAARSRDKRKTKNMELESAIEKLKERKKIVDKTVEDLKNVVATMQVVLKKHKIVLPLF